MKFLIIFIIGLFFVSCHQSPIEDQGAWRKLERNEKIGLYLRVGNRIYGGSFYIKDTIHITPLKDVDASTFEICEGTEYARDKNHVYYPIRIMCTDGEDWGGCYFEEYIVDGASPESFIYIKDDYGVDGYRMYNRGERIEWNDSVFDLSKRHLMSLSQKTELSKVVGNHCRFLLSQDKDKPCLTIDFENGHRLKANCQWEISQDSLLFLDSWMCKGKDLVSEESLRLLEQKKIERVICRNYDFSYIFEDNYILDIYANADTTKINWEYYLPSQKISYVLNGKLEIVKVNTSESRGL